jgi:AraC-like DNA-binding protein
LTVNSFIPAPPLKLFVKEYLIVETENEIINRVLPDIRPTLAFRLRGQVNYIEENRTVQLPMATLSGLRRTARLINYKKNSATLIIVFRELGAASFFKEPLHKLFGESISLNFLIDAGKVAMITEMLQSAMDQNQRLNIVDQFLMTLFRHHSPDLLITQALQSIHQHKGQIQINALAKSFYISNDAFEKRFRKIVGSTPKKYASIIRLRDIVQLGRRSRSLTELALDAGYFDQAHFNKEFRQFTGQTPSAFFAAPASW